MAKGKSGIHGKSTCVHTCVVLSYMLQRVATCLGLVLGLAEVVCSFSCLDCLVLGLAEVVCSNHV